MAENPRMTIELANGRRFSNKILVEFFLWKRRTEGKIKRSHPQKVLEGVDLRRSTFTPYDIPEIARCFHGDREHPFQVYVEIPRFMLNLDPSENFLPRFETGVEIRCGSNRIKVHCNHPTKAGLWRSPSHVRTFMQHVENDGDIFESLFGWHADREAAQSQAARFNEWRSR